MVEDMRPQPRYRPVRTPLVSMGPSLEEERRRHRTARLVAVASVVAVAAVVLLVWLVGMLGREPGVIELEPTGTRANTSFLRRATQRFLSTSPSSDLRWYRLDEGAPSMVVVGALPGTEVYAPIDGSVESISDYELDGEVRGQLIELQPTGDGQTILVLRNLDADVDLEVGTTVTQSVTRLGTVRDMEGAIEAPLAAYTHDTGSGIDMYLRRIDPTSNGLG